MKLKIPASWPGRAEVIIDKYWLGGFVDGDATFSAGHNRPRFKFESHVKEFKLFKAIKE